jgi:hypothetical protein
MTELPKPPALAARGGCWFRSGTTEIHIGIEEPFQPARKAHPGLLVTDLDALAEELTRRCHVLSASPALQLCDPGVHQEDARAREMLGVATG